MNFIQNYELRGASKEDGSRGEIKNLKLSTYLELCIM